MDQERDSGGLMSAPESELMHLVTRLRCELRSVNSRVAALELELSHARGKLHAYDVLLPTMQPRGEA